MFISFKTRNQAPKGSHGLVEGGSNPKKRKKRLFEDRNSLFHGKIGTERRGKEIR